MKIFKSLFVLAFLICSVSLFADDDPTSRIVMKSQATESMTIDLQLFNLQENTTKVEITSVDGEVNYFTQYIRRHNGYTQHIQMKSMKHGTYLLQVKQGKTAKKQVIVISERGLQLSSVAG